MISHQNKNVIIAVGESRDERVGCREFSRSQSAQGTSVGANGANTLEVRFRNLLAGAVQVEGDNAAGATPSGASAHVYLIPCLTKCLSHRQVPWRGDFSYVARGALEEALSPVGRGGVDTLEDLSARDRCPSGWEWLGVGSRHSHHGGE